MMNPFLFGRNILSRANVDLFTIPTCFNLDLNKDWSNYEAGIRLGSELGGIGAPVHFNNVDMAQ